MSNPHKHRIPERLRKREAERKAALEKKRQDKHATTEDNLQRFLLEFTKGKTEIEDKMLGLYDIKEEHLNSTFDELNRSIQLLQKLVSDSVLFLPSYDLQSTQQHVSHLQTALAAKQDELMPKKKFAFSMRKKESDIYDDCRLPVSGKDKESTLPISSVSAVIQCGFSNKQGQNLSMKGSEINSCGVLLDHLINCNVRLFGSPLTLHLTNCADCMIFSGPVSSSVFVDNCRNCTFVVACQQLRTHQTDNSKFYLHVTSKGIIEDCKNVKFAPYNWIYSELDLHYQISGLDKAKNNWNKIDDFNWLSVNEPSPNWEVIEENERVKSWEELVH